MTREQAVKISDTEWWKEQSPERVVGFQLFEDRLCMDMGDFQAMTEEVLGRPVFTHEFARPERLREEFLGISGIL